MAVKQFVYLLGIIASVVPVLLCQPTGDTITPNITLGDGQTLLSAGGTFEFGFFSPGMSSKRYLGVWYHGLPDRTVVWVANRANPLNSTTGMLILTTDGNLALVDGSRTTFWSTGTAHAIDPVLQLQETGNLVLTGGSYKNIVWQSFDYPGDTLLPGMKIGFDFRANLDRYLTSWKSATEPSEGAYYYKLEHRSIPEVFIWEGAAKTFRTGPWNGQGWSGRPDMGNNGMFLFKFVANQYELYYTYEPVDRSVLSRAVMNVSGDLRRDIWSRATNEWQLFWAVPEDPCDNYATCGANGICTPTYSPNCQCLQGFIPVSSKNWNQRQFSDGCARRMALSCSSDGFLPLQNIKLPDGFNATADGNMTLDECRDWCFNNCSCMAYALNGGIGCIIWPGDLLDLRVFTQGGDVLYLRLAASELSKLGPLDGGNAKKPLLIIVLPSVLGFLALVCVMSLLLCWKKKEMQRGSSVSPNTEEREFPSYDFSIIRAATNDFSDDSKLGEGGFGIVYKGRFENGQDIAVKRLIRETWQGPIEFRNELEVIANLQHRNLVRLLGCCVEGDERILILEFMPNRSLDSFIFDREQSSNLKWRIRRDIIMGISRGLQYLHEDSNLTVIHRDLKPSNILLDRDMVPKISDFGIARILEKDTIQGTGRPVGTIGYMAPEYASAGIYSCKSDVFSFGVIILEILSGRRNIMVNIGGTQTNLLGYVFFLLREGRSLEILDDALGCSYPVTEALRYIQIGLLCVQENSEDRPSISEVVLMLANEGVALKRPRQVNTGVAIVPREGEWTSSRELTVTVTGR